MKLTTLLVCMAVLLAACGPAGPGAQASATPKAAPAAEARSSKVRDLAPAVSAGDQAELSAGNRAFAFDLYRALRQEDGNLFYSPYSLSVALAMTYAGARGNTAAQMAETLHFTLPQEQLHPAFNDLDLALKPAGSGEPPFALEVANSLWGQDGYALKPEFLDTLAVNYGAGLRLVDFTSDAGRSDARQAINQWVSDNTAGKIPELIEDGILNDYTRFVLANAIYFKAEWEEPFHPSATQDAPFYRLDGITVTVPLMSRRGMLRYAEGPGFQAIELPYKGGRARFLALLPAEGQFVAFEQGLDAAQVEAVLAGLETKDVKLYLPKYAYSASLSLKETLAAMGMPDAFDDQRADFSGMADIPPVLYVSHVIHKAFVAVDELGTEASAATGVVGEIVSMPQMARLDRPFIFLIYDAPTGSVLFVGRVLDPAP